MQLGETLTSRRRQISWALLAFLICCLLLGAWQMIGLHGKISIAMSDIRSTQYDNRTWVIAQADTELLAYRLALSHLRTNATEEAGQRLRQRFDIFFSRVETVRITLINSPELATPDLVGAWDEIAAMTHSDAAIFDAGDAAVLANLHALEARAATATPKVRSVVVEALQRLIQSGMSLRERTQSLLDSFFLWTVLESGTLIALALGVLLSLYWILRYARLRTLLSERQTKVINTSIDAILICDEAGRLLEYNSAAQKLFALNAKAPSLPGLDHLFVPGKTGYAQADSAVAAKPKTHWRDLAASPGLVPAIMRSCDGTSFPVECTVSAHPGMDGRPIFIVFVHDITRQLENEHRLEAARDAAERGERAKSRFLAVMSHEMRTPLNGLIAALDILHKTTPLSQRQAKFLSVARECGATTLDQIDEVLELTRLDGLTPDEEPQEINLGVLLETLVEQNRPMAWQRGNKIRLDLPHKGLPLFLGPRRTVTRVVLNLLGNALRFTQDGQIDLAVKREADQGDDVWLSLSVSDTGVGIAPDRMDLIFRDFETESLAGPMHSAGTGLGLGIVRRAMDRMGGTVSAVSELGKGSCFTVRFPLRAVSHPAVSAIVPSRATAAGGVETGLFFGTSVLIAEDNDINRLVLAEMLRHLGARVDQAVDGQEAVTMAQAICYDMILMDLTMPGLDGVEATRQIRQAGASSRSPIVGLTAHVMKEELDRMRAAGMVTALSKPVTIDRLQEILSHVGRETNGDGEPALLDLGQLQDMSLALPPLAISDLLGRYRSETEAALSSLADRSSDAELVHRTAGAAAVFGALRLRNRLVSAETALRRQGKIDASLMEEIRDCWLQTRIALDQWSHGAALVPEDAKTIL